ncbi:DUF6415 family natural product biosynthesis protein [Streptomyces sp. NPDC046261]|uniref:DUF6415 family natural product biosynthesis protein n=1 Tax=Streptomyces sp. NPDC046261 TaxID=3157200 RepID=UPI0033C6028E
MPPYPYTGNTGGGITSNPPQAAPGIEAAIHETTATERWLPAPGRVRALTNRLCAFVNATAFDVEAAAARRPVGDPVRVGALAAVREARHRLRVGPGNGYVSAISYVRGLGRTAEDLLRHQKQLRPKAGAPVATAGVSGFSALAAVREARHRLRVGPGNGYVSAISYVRGLGRTAEDLLRHQKQLRPKAGAPVATAGVSGFSALVLGPAETCPVCLGLTAQRHASERRHDWAGMRRANARLGEHRDTEHTHR